MARVTRATETQLATDESLTTDHFEIDEAGHVVVKNQDLAEALKAALPDAPDVAAAANIHVGVVVDFPF